MEKIHFAKEWDLWDAEDAAERGFARGAAVCGTPRLPVITNKADQVTCATCLKLMKHEVKQKTDPPIETSVEWVETIKWVSVEKEKPTYVLQAGGSPMVSVLAQFNNMVSEVLYINEKFEWVGVDVTPYVTAWAYLPKGVPK